MRSKGSMKVSVSGPEVCFRTQRSSNESRARASLGSASSFLAYHTFVPNRAVVSGAQEHVLNI